MELTGCRVVTPTTGVMVDDSLVVAHTTWLARAVQRCLDGGRRFVLATPSSSMLTPGLVEVLRATGSQWAVRDGDGHYDGFTGEALVWTGDGFAPSMELAATFLHATPLARRGVVACAEVVHPARATTRVGLLVDVLCRFATGGGPAGWGVVEPASEPWDQDALTDHVRGAMPLDVWFHAVGAPGPAPFVAVTTVSRRPEGVVERTICQVDVGPVDEPPAGTAPRRWDDADLLAFQDLMAATGVRYGTAVEVEGGLGLMRSPRVQRGVRPLATLLGAELARLHGVQVLLDGVPGRARQLHHAGWSCVGVLHDRSDALADPLFDYTRLADWLVGLEHGGPARDA